MKGEERPPFRELAEARGEKSDAFRSNSCIREGGLTSNWRVGQKSWDAEEGSPAKIIILPRGAMRLAELCSPFVKDCWRFNATV